MNNRYYICLLSCLFWWVGYQPAGAQPQPGDVFREYVWQPGTALPESTFLRVGGRLGYQQDTAAFPNDRYTDGFIPLPHALDLTQALRAEIQVERVQSHEGTRRFTIEVNRRDPILIPDSDSISQPAYDYLRHDYPVVEVPLEQLRASADNAFRLQVDTVQDWGWPQHLVYGVIFRIYYDESKPHPTGSVLTPAAGSALDTTVVLTAAASGPVPIRQVDYLGNYRGLNWEGDGIYQQWHYRFHHGEIADHLGTALTPPYQTNWNTAWVPDQPQPVQIAARITDTTGLTYVTEPVGGITFSRPDFSVELCAPYDQPKQWATRSGEFTEHFQVNGDLSKATGYQLAWVSWSPCYANGVFINDHLIATGTGPCYEYQQHLLTQTDTRVLHSGKNRLTTGKTPLYRDEMVHGMEVQWPGIMVKVRYEK